MVTLSRTEYGKLQAQSKHVSELESCVDVITEVLRLARHKQFGASSEKSKDSVIEQLSSLFHETEVFPAADKDTAENVSDQIVIRQMQYLVGPEYLRERENCPQK